ncbi:MAG: ABC transporter ATP-binding protein [Gammaproteobacteria bacterium]
MIEVENTSKSYRLYDRPRDRLLQTVFAGRRTFYREFQALHDVSLRVGPGESVAIIGRNGAGKSTLLKLIAGVLQPTSGRIRVSGRIAALLQLGTGFNPEFTGRENIYFNGAILGFTRADIKRRFDEIAAFADIGDFIEQPVKSYSSGMTMRLAFAVSVCLEPEILIVDEALAVGDALFQFKCKVRLQEVIQRGTTLLFVSHDMSAVRAFCTRAIYLEHGRKKIEGEPETVTESYFMDVRAEQARSIRQKGEDPILVQPKPSGGFGIADGEILAASFTGTASTATTCGYGDVLRVEVICRYAAHISNPCLSVVIQAANLVGIGGRWFRLERPAERDGAVKVGIRFPAKFAPGRYFITLRLEDREDQQQSFVLHKIPGALSFQLINEGPESLLGFRDLELEAELLQEV